MKEGLFLQHNPPPENIGIFYREFALLLEKVLALEARETWVPIQAVILHGYVTLGKLLNVRDFHSHIYEMG